MREDGSERMGGSHEHIEEHEDCSCSCSLLLHVRECSDAAILLAALLPIKNRLGSALKLLGRTLF